MSAEVAERDDRDEERLGLFEEPAESHHPAALAKQLMELPELQHLAENELRLLWLMRTSEHIQAGRRVLAMVHDPQVQGRLKDLFEQMLVERYGFYPDYIVTVDAAWWAEATPPQRMALCHHELMHVRQAVDRNGEPRFNTQTGEPIYCLVAHDIEEFNKTVERYGLWKEDVQQFAETVRRAEQ